MKLNDGVVEEISSSPEKRKSEKSKGNLKINMKDSAQD